jgi:hypothetical protein
LKILLRTLPFIALLLASLPAAAKPFAPAACDFTADMPQPVTSRITRLGGHMYIVEVGGSAYITECSALSNEVKKARTPPKVLLRRARDAMLDDATLIAEKSLTVQGYPAIDIQMKSNDGYYMRYRVLIAHGQLYQIGLVTTPDKASPPEIEAYISSFQFTGK